MAVREETLQFQAETRHLLDLMIHSLYTTREIFLRELISNASDALDRLRFEMLTRPELTTDGQQFQITLETDPASRTLTVSDNGIGMSREEVIANIGTIAKSGTRELREKVKEGATNETLAELIGQFGVGFYSSFMVADRVEIVTRRVGEEAATRWESDGGGQYTLSDAARAEQGTSVTLHLKPADAEAGVEDYTDDWILARLVKRYSDFVSYPVVYKVRREEKEKNEDGTVKEGGETNVVVEDRVLNSMKPIWARAQSEVSDEEYAEFYKHMFHDAEPPLQTVFAQAEGFAEYKALVFVPAQAPYDLYYHAAEADLRLYARGVLIMEGCDELLPRYLRFIKGVVDSADLPLNISRQMLQQERQTAQIRKWLTKKILDALLGTYERDYDKYLKFWRQFGRALKEGVGSDFDNRERLVSLLLFESSHDAEELTNLKSYVGRMKEGQQEIFYLTGESRAVVENSPHLEAFREKGYEVLYLIDPVDELVAQSLTDFEGRRLKSVGKGVVKLEGGEEGEQSEKELKKKAEEASGLLEYLQKSLDKEIKEVRLSNRLTSSPACLVTSEMDYSPRMERLLQVGQEARPKQRRIMELNPRHEIFVKMQNRFQADKEDPALGNYAQLLLGYALLAEGSQLTDPVAFNRLLAELLTQTL